jgi:hypothetical protein
MHFYLAPKPAVNGLTFILVLTDVCYINVSWLSNIRRNTVIYTEVI